jgi:hypothetical protein
MWPDGCRYFSLRQRTSSWLPRYWPQEPSSSQSKCARERTPSKQASKRTNERTNEHALPPPAAPPHITSNHRVPAPKPTAVPESLDRLSTHPIPRSIWPARTSCRHRQIIQLWISGSPTSRFREMTNSSLRSIQFAISPPNTRPPIRWRFGQSWWHWWWSLYRCSSSPSHS